MFSKASFYNDHSKSQQELSRKFFSSIAVKMDWKQEEYDVVMDMGCGTGSCGLQIVLPTFPRVKKIIGIDIQPEMIEFAKEHNAHEKIEYHVGDIQDTEEMQKWSHKISKIICNFSLHWCKDQQRVFSNMYKILKPGGEAAIIHVISAAFWDSCIELIESPKWKKYLQNATSVVPDSHTEKFGSPHYKQMVEKIGFNVIACESKEEIHTFHTDEEARGTNSVLCKLSNYVPEELKNEFMDDFCKACIQHNGRNSSGRALFRQTLLYLLIQKPKH